MAQHTAPQQKVDLGPGFWPVTIGLSIFNLIASYFIATTDLATYLPAAAAPAGEIDGLIKFMAVFGNAIFVYVTGFIVYFAIVWRRARATRPIRSESKFTIRINSRSGGRPCRSCS